MTEINPGVDLSGSSNLRRLLVTGANGFVGRALCSEALQRGLPVRGVLRGPSRLPEGVEPTFVDEIDGSTDWVGALKGVDVIVHCAARVHVMKDAAVDPLAEFLKVNLDGTSNLAYQSARAGVKRLVFVSSIKVNGEQTSATQPYSESDEPQPQDAYGISKWQTEQALQRIAQETGLEIVIVRPPLVYGSGVKGNFNSLLRGVCRGFPLPLGAVKNARSLLYVENLADALILCATHPGAAGQTYLVSDGEDVSTADLIRRMADALACKARLFYFPPQLMRAFAALLGRSDKVDRLFGSLRVSSEKIRSELGWSPRYSLSDGLRKTADWYRSEHPR